MVPPASRSSKNTVNASPSPEAADVAGLERGGHGCGEWGGGRLVGEHEFVERSGLDTHRSREQKTTPMRIERSFMGAS